ncbi:hypothetical protein ACN20G_28900 (plasmid) [Streptomyces sp. BI20]|uniref:hypothetical protein n=1 Tax=Streptomyces sp. BI20 TaxID=3403460 RepID=UPI003C747E84
MPVPSRCSRPRSRSLAAGLAGAGVLALLVTIPAGASTAPKADAGQARAAAAPSTTVSGGSQDAFTRIAVFYGAYVIAETDGTQGGAGVNRDDLRASYLTPALRNSLATWENANHADGVLRAQNVPLSWKVTAAGTTAGKVNATVTLIWNTSGSSTSQLKVQADATSHRITSIAPATG